MAVDMFLEFKEKIEGETEDSKMKDKKAMDILAWSWGVSQSGTFHMGGGGGAGAANFQDVTVTKYIDKASHMLLTVCGTGDHISEAKLTCRKAGKEQVKYVEITMKPVMVTSVSTGGSGGEERLTENVTLNFGAVKFEYFKQDDKGSSASAGIFSYDITAKVETG